MSQQDTTTVNPELLKSLGKVMPTTPADRPPANSKSQGIVKPLNPPVEFNYGMDLNVPNKK